MNKKTIIIISGFFLIVIAWILLILMPYLTDKKGLELKIEDLEKRRSERISEEQLNTVENEIDSINAVFDVVTSKLLPEDRLLNLGRQMERIGKLYGLKMISINPEYENLNIFGEVGKAKTEFPTAIEYEGTFNQFTRFVDDINNFPILFRMTEVVLQKESIRQRNLSMIIRGKIVVKRKDNI